MMFSVFTRKFFQNAQGFGKLVDFSHHATVGDQSQGHYFQIWILLDENKVVKSLGFECPRCVPAIACGAYLFENSIGKLILDLKNLQVEDLLKGLGGLPPERLFYAWMAVEYLQQIVRTHESKLSSPL